MYCGILQYFGSGCYSVSDNANGSKYISSHMAIIHQCYLLFSLHMIASREKKILIYS